MVCTFNVILLSLIKQGNLTYVTTWMNFEDIMLRKISQSQKDKYCMILFPCVIKIIKTESRMVAARG